MVKTRHLNSVAVSRIPTRLTAPSRTTGNGLPGKRPHGNRIRAGGLSAASSAPVSHFLTRWCASHWRVDFLPRSGTDQNKSGKLHATPFLGLFAEEEWGLIYFRPDICIFIFDNGADRTPFGGHGHHDCGAGCVRLRSVAHRYNSQSLLLFTIVFARRTDRGLCVQRECGQQTGRYRAAQVGDSSNCSN